jgi:hypothetical protein
MTPINHRIYFNMNITTGTTSGLGSTNPSGEPPTFSKFCVAQILVFESGQLVTRDQFTTTMSLGILGNV